MATMKDLGNRLQCNDCGIKFYDMKRPNALCPKCSGEPRKPTKTKFVSSKAIEIDIDPEEVEIPVDDEMEMLSFDSIEEEVDETKESV
jgi:hypothetical protein